MSTQAYPALQSQVLSMTMGTSITVGSFTVLRIPGGWIWYTSSIAVFVPKQDADNK
jgi:hypothetical protein